MTRRLVSCCFQNASLTSLLYSSPSALISHTHSCNTMSLMRKSDPFCLGDCITYQELLTSFSYNGAPQNIMIYLASKALVSLVNDAQWDVDRIRPSVFSFVDTDAILYEDLGPGSMATLLCCDRTVSDLLAGVVRFTDL